MGLLAQMYPEVPPSVIADALGDADDNVQRAAHVLFSATPVRTAHATFGYSICKRLSMTRWFTCQCQLALVAIRFELHAMCVAARACA